jgi:hypothetical protein
MAGRIIWSPRAAENLEQIFRYIAQENSAASFPKASVLDFEKPDLTPTM